MIITSLNLFGRFDEWDHRQANIISYLSDMQPDVVFFQEVVYLPDVSPRTQVSELNDTLKYRYENIAVTRLQTSETYSEYREGQGIISKFPIIKSETLVLRQHPEDRLQRIVQLVDIDCGGQIIKFANVQFAELPRHAGLHFKEVLEILHSRNEKRIIVGDFNIPDIEIEMYQGLWDKEYTSSSSEQYISYPSMRTRLDYILIPKTYTLDDIKLSGDDLSDHRALSADVHFAVKATSRIR